MHSLCDIYGEHPCATIICGVKQAILELLKIIKLPNTVKLTKLAKNNLFPSVVREVISISNSFFAAPCNFVRLALCMNII